MISIILMALTAVLALVFLFVGLKFVRRSRGINPTHYAEKWLVLQKQCASRKTWPLAIVDADNLLDEALCALHYKGKTPGERLVAAQHELTANDAVWFAHKYRARIETEDVRKLKKQDVMSALLGFRQALKDLGALSND